MLYDVKWDKTVEVKPEPWRAALIGAADYIEQHGWHQGAMYENYTEEYPAACLIGAIYCGNRNGNRRPTHTQNEKAVGDAIQAVQKTLGIGALSYWNDNQERSKDHVIDVLRLAAKVEQL